jgi:hypothetical protein
MDEIIVQKFIDKLLPYGNKDFGRGKVQTSPELIFALLTPSIKFRLGKCIPKPNVQYNTELIRTYMECGLPIPVVVTVGTSKWYDGTCYEENVAGLSELLMIEKIAHLDRRVRLFYSPGINVVMLAEDTTNEWLYGQVNDSIKIKNNNLRYLSSLKEMLSKTSLTKTTRMTLKTEQELLDELSLSRWEYEQRCEKNMFLFKSYIEKLQSGKDLSIEYRNLADEGWQGGLHPDLIQFYLGQFRKSLGNIADEQRYIAAYFAGVLSRKQLNFLFRLHNGKAIKLAFMRYPPGTLLEQQNALQISQHPLTGFGASHQCISPWAALTGVVQEGEGNLSLKVVPAKDSAKILRNSVQINYANVRIKITLF